MRTRSRLTVSIVITLVSSALVHALFLFAITRAYGVPPHFLPTFLLVLAASHAALLVFLLVMRRDFFIVPEGTSLRRINLANGLSIARIGSTPTVLFLLIFSRDYGLAALTIIFTALVFLTDLFDGVISRRGHQETRIGAYLDSISDYAILIVVSVAFDYYGLISRWFFVAIMFRLFFMFAGVAGLLVYHGRADVTSTLWGKILVSATMILYAASLLELFETTAHTARRLTSLLEYLVAVVVVVSTAEKAVFLFRAFRRARAERRRQTAHEATGSASSD